MQLELKTASMQDVGMYNSYFFKSDKKVDLTYGIALFQQGVVQGERQIENSQPIAFQANWKTNSLPEGSMICQVSFDNDADLIYDLAFTKTHLFVSYLVDVVILYKNKKIIDFPQDFYFELFRLPTKAALKQI